MNESPGRRRDICVCPGIPLSRFSDAVFCVLSNETWKTNVWKQLRPAAVHMYGYAHSRSNRLLLSCARASKRPCYHANQGQRARYAQAPCLNEPIFSAAYCQGCSILSHSKPIAKLGTRRLSHGHDGKYLLVVPDELRQP